MAEPTNVKKKNGKWMRGKWSLAYFQHTVLTHNPSEKNGTNVKYLTHDSNISSMDSDIHYPKFTSH
jgi:hypothetical protein